MQGGGTADFMEAADELRGEFFSGSRGSDAILPAYAHFAGDLGLGVGNAKGWGGE